jgi:FAD/FMN-containing dehydrogenase
MMTEIIKKLINLLGEKKVKFSKDYLEKYGIDWYKEIKPDPTAIVFPYNENDLQEIVLFAEKEDQKLVISGGRTGLCGGATAANKEIVVSLEKMNDMNWIPKKNQVICQAGAITDNVKNFVAEHDRLLPISLASSSSSSIGGNVATNAAGSKFIKYGSTKDHIAKIKVMLANGEMLTLKKEIKKDATGPNLMELFFGSEGVLGIIYEVTFNTCEQPKYIENILIRTSELNSIRQHILAPEVKNIISSIEYWDENCQKLLGDSPESTYFVVVELSSSSKDEIDLCLETLAEKNINIALLNSKQSDEVWAKREDLPVNLASKGAYKMDISLPLETLENFLDEIKQLSPSEIFSFGHLGDGNIHINIVSESNKDKLIDEVYGLLKSHHGSPSAEHGIGQRKKEIWTKFEDYQDKYKLLQTLKKSMDPKNILSPKVFFE